jgi:flagellar hook protein FlgE
MNNASSIAQSGIEAYAAKMDVTANNIANVSSENFKPSKVTMAERRNGGVDATVTKAADQVDISNEAVQMLTTVNSFKANLQALKTDNQMTKSLLDIIS